MKRPYEHILNLLTDEGTLSMQLRLFRMICLASFLLCAVIIPINALQHLPSIINIGLVLFGSFSLLLFRETFRGKDHVVIYFLVLLLLLTIIWFPNGGTTGSIIFYFAAAIIYPMALARGALRWVLIGLLVLDASALTVIEHFRPSLVTPFQSETARLIDLLTGIFCSSLVGVSALWVVITNYDWEREAIGSISKKLTESEKLYRDMVESARTAIIRMDRSGVITFFNSFAEFLFGFDRKKMVGLSITTLFSGADVAADDGSGQIRRVLRDPSQQVQFESKNIRSDGIAVWLNWTVQPIRNEEHDVVEFLCLGADITEHRALEEKRKQFDREMIQVQKIESLGILAGGIAHDFNNILSAILGNIGLVRMDLDPASDAHRRLAEAERASLHARDLTAQLLTFSEGGLPASRTIFIGSLLRDSIAFSLRGSSVASTIKIAYDLWPIDADAGQLRQVFNNLIINACQAMPSGGNVTVEASNVQLDATEGLPVPPGPYVLVTVRDEGAGILEKHLSKIFDPYFTTKRSASGLGLAVAYSIIKNHNGHIAVRSRMGEGTTFLVYLPVAGKVPADVPVQTHAGTSRIANVLVMEDEASMQSLVGAILRKYGHTVEFVRSGQEAIERYRKARTSGLPFDIVLMDLTIPGGMGGKDAIQQLRDLDPAVRAIATTGYANDPVMARYRDYGFRDVIKKPYFPEELRDVLERVLAEEPPSNA
jgi:PAS domain S-box-containing protein